MVDRLDASKNFLLTPSNSEVVHIFGQALSATPTGLLFDFSQVGAKFLVQGELGGNSQHDRRYRC